MRVFITVLVLIFSLQSLTKADDIRDFQIEGISIGDSLLDYFSESEIERSKDELQYKANKFYQVTILSGNFDQYDAMHFQLKNNDNKFIIYSMSGIIELEIKKCLKKQKKIFKELLTLFDNPKTSDEGKRKHPGIKNAYTYDNYILVKSDMISVSCYEFINSNFAEKLLISADTAEFNNFLNTEAH